MYACSFLKYWAGLQKKVDKEDILAGAEALQKMVLSYQVSTSTYVMRRLDPSSSMEDEENYVVAAKKQYKY
jgi:hypothetical protein